MSLFEIFRKKKSENLVSKTKVSKDLWDAFKKQYKEEHGRKLSDEEAIAIALFENSILHTQNFVSRLELEIGQLDFDIKTKLSEDISSYSLSLMFIYMSYDKKFDVVRNIVLNEYEKFIETYSGTSNQKQQKELFQLLLDKLNRHVIWLSSPFEKSATIHKIISGISYISLDNHKPTVERLVSDIELSMKHFGILND